MADKQAVDIAVPSKDPEKPEKASGDVTAKGKQKEEAEQSEEDVQLQGELEMLVQRLKEPAQELYRPALESLRTLIRTATSSMTSVPKPLKFLRSHFPDLQVLYDSFSLHSKDERTSNLFADILSVLAMTYSDTGKRDTLKYRLTTSKRSQAEDEDPGSWGHEYVRHLAAEIGEEFEARQEAAAAESTEQEGSIPVPQDLLDLALRLVPFFLSHNGEADAVDLLMDLESIDAIIPFVDDETYVRVCQYMVGCVNLLVPPDDRNFLQTARSIYRKHGRFTESITLAMRLGDMDAIVEDFQTPTNPSMQRQLAYLLARQQITLPQELLQKLDDEQSPLLPILNNTVLASHFQDFVKTLNLTEPRSLEDTYKSHLDDNPSATRAGGAANVDSAKQNLAGTFVNAFVNAGYGNDKLMVGAEEGQSWVYKNKDDGMLSATASLGLSLLWDPEVGLSHIDKYSYATEEYIKAGALLADGIIHSGIKTENDAAFALLCEYVESKSVPLRVSSTIGIGIAYAGTAREDIQELLIPSLADGETTMEICAMTALSLGFAFVGSANGEIAGTILQVMMERDEKELDEKWARFLGLGLALLFLGKQDQAEITLETLKAIEHPLAKQAAILVDACAFAGTGNVLKIQSMLHHCNQHYNVPDLPPKDGDAAPAPAADENENGDVEMSAENAPANGQPAANGTSSAETPKSDEPKKPESDIHQAFAVLGIALVAMGEDVGAEMSLRSFNHLMHYGEPVIRKTVPLALGLISASNPQLPIMETLSRYSHDNDLDVALNAIFAMGLMGAGSNNAKLAQLLRQLAIYYYKEPDCLFAVRVAQGLVYMGKGCIGVNPFHSDRFLMSPVAVAGLLSTLMAFTDAKSLILDKSHWMLYFLSMAMHPLYLLTFNEEGETMPVSVRVGKAVDVIGQAGKPRTISGFQTHQSPVRLGARERAELATEEYFAYTHVLEGLVVLKKNEQFESEEGQTKTTTKMDTT